MTVLEGEVEFLRHDDGRVEILQAPPVVRVALELLTDADPVVFKVFGDRLVFAGRVTYRVFAWDGHSKALLAELIEDRRLR